MKKNDSIRNASFPQTHPLDQLKKISEIGIKEPTIKNINSLVKPVLSSNRLSFPSKDLPNQTLLKSTDFPKLNFDDKFRKTNLSTKILKNICKKNLEFLSTF